MIGLILILAIVGFIVWLVTTQIPMPPIFKTIIYVVVAIVLILYLMQVFGVVDAPIPRLR